MSEKALATVFAATLIITALITKFVYVDLLTINIKEGAGPLLVACTFCGILLALDRIH